jgi:glutathione synthase/RimK-type ligase-like ATP-grasp enzyme
LTRGSRIELWVEERNGKPAVNPIMRTLLRTLTGDGAKTLVRVPEREVHDPANLDGGPDLVLLKSATDLALSHAVATEASGISFLNGARVTLRAHDKAATVARLAAVGLPVPETFLLQGGAEVFSMPAEEGGWVLKPARGIHGRGVSFHENLAAALAAPSEVEAAGSFVADDGTRLLQRRVGGDEPDLKVYVADKSSRQ